MSAPHELHLVFLAIHDEDIAAAMVAYTPIIYVSLAIHDDGAAQRSISGGDSDMHTACSIGCCSVKMILSSQFLFLLSFVEKSKASLVSKMN